MTVACVIVSHGKMKNLTSPPICITIPLHAKVTKVVDPSSTSSHCIMSLAYDPRIMLFVDVDAKDIVIGSKDLILLFCI